MGALQSELILVIKYMHVLLDLPMYYVVSLHKYMQQ